MFFNVCPPSLPCRLNRLVCICFVQVDGSSIMELHWPRTNRSGRLLRHEFTAYIKGCVKCDRAEFCWWPIYKTFDDETLQLTCSRCIDMRNTNDKTRWFVLMYNARIPPDVFGFLYSENWKQWMILRSCQIFKIIENLRQIMGFHTHAEQSPQSPLPIGNTNCPRPPMRPVRSGCSSADGFACHPSGAMPLVELFAWRKNQRLAL